MGCVALRIFWTLIYACVCWSRFFFNDTATTEIYTLSLHDALPIYFNGWYMDMPAIGERLLKPMEFYDGSNILVMYSQVDRKSTRLNSSHSQISYAVFCLKKKKHAPGIGGTQAACLMAA